MESIDVVQYGMALCLIYRFGFSWPVTLVLAVAYCLVFVVMLLVALRVTRPLARPSSVAGRNSAGARYRHR